VKAVWHEKAAGRWWPNVRHHVWKQGARMKTGNKVMGMCGGGCTYSNVQVRCSFPMSRSCGRCDVPAGCRRPLTATAGGEMCGRCVACEGEACEGGAANVWRWGVHAVGGVVRGNEAKREPVAVVVGVRRWVCGQWGASV